MALAELNAELDAALERRVVAHQERKAGRLSVAAYKRELAGVRKIEDRIEPLRVALGAQCSLALERSLQHNGAEERCKWCGGENTVGTCPRAIECPTCGAAPGARCKRPSEHSGPMIAVHVARIEAAELPGPPELRPEPFKSLSTPPRLAQQLDVFGGATDMAPRTRQEKLFLPAPAQLQGQTYIDTESEANMAEESERRRRETEAAWPIVDESMPGPHGARAHADAELGERVLVEGGGTSAQWARVAGVDPARPHLAKVTYEESGTAVWVARKRFRAAYRPRA
jgi:hypothetical protein